MRKSRYSDEQIAAALRQAEGGTPGADITRKLGIKTTFHVWKKGFGSLGTPEIRELRQLRDENSRLKQVVAALTLDRHVLQDVLKKKVVAGCAAKPFSRKYAKAGASANDALRDSNSQPSGCSLPIAANRNPGSHRDTFAGTSLASLSPFTRVLRMIVIRRIAQSCAIAGCNLSKFFATLNDHSAHRDASTALNMCQQRPRQIMPIGT